MEFYKFIEKEKQKQTDIIFLIWWAYGVTDQIKKSFDLSLSLSSMTFPHSMALLLLVEQLYRVQSISQGKKYHH
jgi:23S rRNA (pseudouridine1915-N3)-methyltransferase